MKNSKALGLIAIIAQLDKCKTDWECWRLLHTVDIIIQNNPNLIEILPSNIKRVLYGKEIENEER